MDFRSEVAPLEAVTISAAPQRRFSLPMIIGVILLVAAAAVVAYFAWTLVSAEVALPPPQVAAAPAVGLPARALPPPTDDEIRDLLEGRWSFGQGI